MEIDINLFITVIFGFRLPCVLNESWLWTLYPQLTTWNDAARFCNDKGGRLLKLDSLEKNDILDDMSHNLNEWGNPIWIGLHYNTNSGKRFWQGKCNDLEDTSEYSNWDSSDRPDDSKPCTMLDAGSFTWRPEVCKQEYAIICETPTDSISACGHYSEMVDGVQLCVLAVTDSKTTLPNNFRNIFGVDSPPCYAGDDMETTSPGITSRNDGEEASLCPCQCIDTTNITEEILTRKLEELQKTLTINKKETLKSKLKLVSATDERTSSTAIGVFGIIIIIAFIMFIVLLDVLRFFRIRH